MEMTAHRFRELFDQLGLPSDNESIASFIELNRPLPGIMLLADASCWTPAQAALAAPLGLAGRARRSRPDRPSVRPARAGLARPSVRAAAGRTRQRKEPIRTTQSV